jgi:hypothetical protein
MSNNIYRNCHSQKKKIQCRKTAKEKKKKREKEKFFFFALLSKKYGTLDTIQQQQQQQHKEKEDDEGVACEVRGKRDRRVLKIKREREEAFAAAVSNKNSDIGESTRSEGRSQG